MARYTAIIQLDSEDVLTLQRILSTEQAVQYCGGRKNFDDLVSHHGLQSYSKARGSITYDVVDIDAAINAKKAKDATA